MHYYAHAQIRVSEEKQAFSVFLFSARYWIIARYVHAINSKLMQYSSLLQSTNHLTLQLKKEKPKNLLPSCVPLVFTSWEGKREREKIFNI